MLGGLGVEDGESFGREHGCRAFREPVHPIEEGVGAVAVPSAQGACHGPGIETVRSQVGPQVGQVPGAVKVFADRYEMQRRGAEDARRNLNLLRAQEQ